jgi:hypothetical protein
MTKQEEAALEAVDLDSLSEDAADPGDAPPPAPPAPLRTDPGWSDHVMSLFAPDEVSPDGNPFVFGLRRVVQLVLGEVVSSRCKVEQPPTYAAGGMLQPAVVSYEVQIRLPYGETVSYADCADVFHANTEPQFSRFPTATASTRAEARALRKALGLRRCAAEEMTEVPIEQPTHITSAQVKFIETLCRKLDIDVMKFINSGKSRYASIGEVPYETAKKMNERLHQYQQQRDLIPEELAGFSDNWRG